MTEDAKPQWGILTPQHMVEHLEYLYDTAIGKVQAEVITPDKYIERLQDSLFNYEPMIKHYDHPMLKKGELESLRHGNLEEAKQALLQAHENYEEHYRENPEAQIPHSVFGNLDKELWDLLNRKHFNHHFGQFGIL